MRPVEIAGTIEIADVDKDTIDVVDVDAAIFEVAGEYSTSVDVPGCRFVPLSTLRT